MDGGRTRPSSQCPWMKRAHRVNRVSTGSRPRLARPGAVWLVLGSITTVQVGAAIAKHLFGLATPTGIVWLRLATAAVILLLWSRPRRRARRDELVDLPGVQQDPRRSRRDARVPRALDRRPRDEPRGTRDRLG